MQPHLCAFLVAFFFAFSFFASSRFALLAMRTLCVNSASVSPALGSRCMLLGCCITLALGGYL